MRILVTGAAGFIGSALTLALLARGDEVVGVDNHNDYYDPALKEARIARQLRHSGYTHRRLDIADRNAVAELFSQVRPQRVVNLAAQAGVRHSLVDPAAYVDTNLVGFGNILEGCRRAEVEHLVYASSSSVYGANERLPYSVADNVDHPLSLYAATKKANELMAHSYSHLFELPTTGLRFFTVYGPWGRPDMAYFIFTRKILAGEPIDLFNGGDCRRDFTYIDDIIEGVVRLLDQPPSPTANPTPSPASSAAPWRIYNVGNHTSVPLMTLVTTLEQLLGRQAKHRLLPMQPGDVAETYADVAALKAAVGFQPATPLEEGLARFVDWYRGHFAGGMAV